MQELYYEKLDQKVYKEKLDNGLEVVIVPMNTNNKFVVWGANVGSVDNKFIAPGENDITVLPDGIAHYLEHKLFEQESGRNSLDTLTALGIDANAYTSNDHTAYLFGCTDNYEEALDEFMDYVQHPYFTEENIEKERGIIGQEIMMYDDEPEWAVYINAMKIMYHANEIRIDEAGTIETIKEIDKEKLYKLYNSFYTPDNMYMVLDLKKINLKDGIIEDEAFKIIETLPKFFEINDITNIEVILWRVSENCKNPCCIRFSLVTQDAATEHSRDRRAIRARNTYGVFFTVSSFRGMNAGRTQTEIDGKPPLPQKRFPDKTPDYCIFRYAVVKPSRLPSITSSMLPDS